MNRANVKSIGVIREFRHDLLDYQEDLRQTLDMVLAQLVRAVDYFDSNRANYWPAQVRRASDRLAQARADLECCQTGKSPDEGRSCYEEKKALQRAKTRLEFAEQRVRATRKWQVVVHRQVDEFRTRLMQLQNTADTDLPRAIALLDRLARRLEHYADIAPVSPTAPTSEPN